MATQSLKLTATPLYGVLVTSKSYHIGVRHEVHSHHARFLAYRIAGAQLPPELVDQVAEHLLKLLDKDGMRVFNSLNKDHRKLSRKFGFRVNNETRAQQSARLHIGALAKGLKGMKVQLRRPGGGEENFAHISAGEMKPSLNLIVPGCLPAMGGPAVELERGRVKVTCRPNSEDDIPSVEEVEVSGTGESSVGRMVQIDGIEDAVATWDPEALKSLVDCLGLQVVRVQGEKGDPLKPQLRFWQLIDWMS